MNTTIESPIGTLHAAATREGIAAISFTDVPVREEEDVPAREHLEQLEVELSEYFAGTRTNFDVPLDLRQMAPFRTSVTEELRKVGYGRTITYRKLADSAGNPGAVRAVGTTCAQNPLLIVIPCHRVTRSDGTSGQYAGGREAKEYLLRLERSL